MREFSTTPLRSGVPPAVLKRGHNRDFALTKIQLENLIKSTTNPKSRAIIVLASRGFPVREIVEFHATILRYTVDPDPRLANLRQIESECLMAFPEGFDISSVAVWRRVKKALVKASEKGVLHFDPEKVPFPEALRVTKEDPHIGEKLAYFAKRIHILSGGAFDPRDPLKDCPHPDCSEYRDLLQLIAQEKKIP